MTGRGLEAARVLCGSSLDALHAAEHVMADRTSLLAIWIKPSERAGLTLRCSSDGWGLSLDRNHPEAVDLGPYGETRLVDRSRELGIGITRVDVDQVLTIETDDSTEPFGLGLGFRSATTLHVLNWGDELRIVESGSHELCGASYRQLCG